MTNNLSTGTSTLGGATADDTYWEGNVTLAKNVTLTAVPGGYTEFDGNISGTGNITVTGGGTVNIWQSQVSNTGTITVAAGGVMEVDGDGSSTVNVSSPITVNGSLAGYQGIIGATVNVTSTGTVAPGGNSENGTNGAVTYIKVGATTLAGHYVVKVDDTANDELISSGAINISGAHVDVSVLGGGFTQSSYVIATGTSITGTPASVTSGYQVKVVTSGSVQQLQLSVAPASSYSTWIANYPSLTGSAALPTATPKGDGLTNLVKYALGLDPTVAHGAVGSLDSGTHTLTFNKGTMAAGDSTLSYSILESTDMVTWTTATTGVTNSNGSITFTFPTPRPSKIYARLQVTQN